MFERLFSESYMPHGHCYFWEPDLVWLHLLSDMGVFAAYMTIPAFLAILLKRRGDIELRSVVWLFVAFIMLCGVTHLMGAITIWHPFYRMEGILKAATALVSIATAIMLFRKMPLALSIPSPSALQAEVEQRKATEEKVRDELSRNEAILAALPDVIFELDEQRKLVSVGGTTVGSSATGDGLESWERDVLEQLDSVLDELGEVTRLVSHRFRLRDRNGVELDYLARVVRMSSGGWVASIQDVSEHTRLVESLKASREILEQFVFTASHDLRSPLRAVSQLATWLEEDLGPTLEGENLDNLVTLRQRVGRMDGLLAGLLEFSRAGRTSDQLEPVDLRNVLDLVVEHEVSEQSTGRDISGFVIRAEGDLPVIETIRAPLDRILANLVINSVKHHDRDEGEVVLRVDDSHPHHVVLEVEDDGPGIAPKYQERVFQLFQTLVPKDRMESSGLGLAIARRTVTAVGGSLELESPVRQGRGTLFRIVWPRRVREFISAPFRNN
ncbi:MAG: HAMP domain-containing histidine kinase [Deltaproteobacteria bacterium]|nr:HAMP domain-containing histidine kinase [Deltaproteobacteria bacterium]